MKHQKLDEFLKSKVDKSATPVPDNLWNKIEERMDKNDRLKQMQSTKVSFMSLYKRIVGVSVAASVGILLSIVIFNTESGTNGHEVKSDHTIAHNNQINAYVPTSTSNAKLTYNIPSNNIQQYQRIIAQNQNVITDLHRSISHNNAKAFIPESNIAHIDSVIFTTSDQFQPVVNLKQRIYEYNQGVNLPKEPIEIAYVDPIEKIHDDQHISVGPLMKSTDTEKTLLDNTGSIIIDDKYAKQSVLTIGGGYNFGTLDQGYAFSLTTKKDINRKWYIEGNVGVVFNDAGQNQSMFAGDFLSLKKSMKMNTNSVTSSVGFDNPNDYIFLQFSPVIGYNISQFINIGIGPDYQQLISNLGHDIIYFSGYGSGNLLPSRDLGLLSKADFKLNKRINAGVMYRSGINSYIRNDINIKNRNYFQLQLNYILHKK